MQRFASGVVALGLCLTGCSGGAGNEVGKGNATANAAAPAGPCPFPNRGWRAEVVTEGTPPELRIALTGEVGQDGSGRTPMQASADTPPPVIALELQSEGAMAVGAGTPAWQEGTTYFNYQPGHTTAVIRCDGREVARIPIPPPSATPRRIPS